jgi:predicted DNA-binding WGR domain protein
MDWFADEGQAVAALITLEASKRQRGYWVEPQQLAMFDLTG